MIRVLISDDHAVLRHGLRLILQSAPDITVIGEAGTGADAVAQAITLTPDVVLMDLDLPDMSGIEATQRIRAACPETRVLILTVSDRKADFLGALKAGARGYLLKSMDSREVLAANPPCGRGRGRAAAQTGRAAAGRARRAPAACAHCRRA